MSDLEDRIAELEEYTRRVIPARDGTDGWCNYISSSIAASISRERSYFEDLLTEVIAKLHRDVLDEAKAAIERALAQRIRGTHNPKDEYSAGDVVALDGASFVARKNSPGECPGPGWQLLARQGQRGVVGPKGERGPAGKTITGWIVDRSCYRVTPRLSDGTLGPPLELRELFAPSEDTA